MTRIDKDMVNGFHYERHPDLWAKPSRKRVCAFYSVRDIHLPSWGCVTGPKVLANEYDDDDDEHDVTDVVSFCLTHWQLAPKRPT